MDWLVGNDVNINSKITGNYEFSVGGFTSVLNNSILILLNGINLHYVVRCNKMWL